MKKIFALAAVAALTAGVSAYAANPFSDVGMDHWAYQAVADLSAQGVVEGYPNGTFGGEKHITRFEVAQIVARLLAQESQLNASQKATVEKLAAEYADELSNLGVRVSNLENKVGNITWSGDARVKYEHKDEFKALKKKDPNHVFDSYTARMRLNLKAQANPQVAVKAQVESSFDLDKSEAATFEVKRLHGEYTPVKGFTIDAGRTDVTLGTGAWYDGAFDGVVVSHDLGKYNVQAGYGRYRGLDFATQFAYQKKDKSKGKVGFNLTSRDDQQAWFAQAGVRVNDKVQLGSFFTHFAKIKKNRQAEEFVGFNGKVQLNKVLSLEGDYVRSISKPADADHDARFWTVGATYDMGMAQLGLHYYDVEGGSYLGGSNAAIDDKIGGYKNHSHGAQSWVASAKVAVAKDVTLNANYKFNSKTQSFKGEKRSNYNDIWNVSLNYVF
ncbi:porin [Dialister micraerophilus]|uniref:SLH domain-containing protein n=1 Tax=Dialister micraerophilus UPII 345-E TaxID=910314 RepID=E4L9K0_9FIRM|nr:porin [Dialister micraerophilus]EFR42474.1 hypothetical protein HMPREF9220_0426 [Dialister micraerophilus UPII 345-E]